MPTFQQMLSFKKELLIDDKYRVIRRIGGGSFGDIYLAVAETDGLSKCARIDQIAAWCNKLSVKASPSAAMK